MDKTLPSGEREVVPMPYWRKIDENAPYGRSCLLINDKAKVPAYGPLHRKESFYTHYHIVESFE